MPDLSLKGKTAVITGGSKGLGRAIAETFAEAGAQVVLASRNEDQLREAASGIESRGGRTLAVATDVSQPGQVERLIDRAVEEFGGIDILVNNAGAAPFLVTMAKPRGLEKFEQFLHLNFVSAVYCTRAAAPHLLANPGSCVLNM